MFWSFPEIRDDLLLPLVSEPLPAPVPSTKTDSTPECDLDLDVTLEPREETPHEEEQEDAAVEPAVSQRQTVMSEELKCTFLFTFFYLLLQQK